MKFLRINTTQFSTWLSMLVLSSLLAPSSFGNVDGMPQDVMDYCDLMKDVLHLCENLRLEEAYQTIAGWETTHKVSPYAKRVLGQRERVTEAANVLQLVERQNGSAFKGMQIKMGDDKTGEVIAAKEGSLKLRVKIGGVGKMYQTVEIRKQSPRTIAALIQRADPENYPENALAYLIASQHFGLAMNLLKKSKPPSRAHTVWLRDWHASTALVHTSDEIKAVNELARKKRPATALWMLKGLMEKQSKRPLVRELLRPGMLNMSRKLAKATNLELNRSGFSHERPPSKAAPEVRAGKVFYVEMPELGKTWAEKEEWAKPTTMGVYIPKDYTEARTFPLFVWFNGGFGAWEPYRAKDITEHRGFICVALPYRWHSEEQGGGWKSTPWSYYEAMLDRLEEMVPNIDPDRRVCVGFSSGGCAIARLLGTSDGGYQSYFTGFLPGGAGWDMGGLDTIKGKHMLVFCGEKDTRYKNLQNLYEGAKKAGVKAEMLTLKDTVHDLPRSYYPAIRKWICDHVLYGGLSNQVTHIERNIQQHKWTAALADVRNILETMPENRVEYRKARELIKQIEDAGEKKVRQFLLKRRPAKTMRAFVRAWEPCKAAETVRAAANVLAEDELAAIMSKDGPSRRKYLLAFLETWEGYPTYSAALLILEEAALDEFETIQKIEPKSLRLEKYEEFIKKWTPAPITDKVAEALATQRDGNGTDG